MAKKKVYVSFDFDNDRALKNFIIEQARRPDSPFQIIDTSLKEAVAEKDWLIKAKRRIKLSDIMLVMVGAKTHKATGVLKEVVVANAEKIPIVQIIGYREGNYTPVPAAGRLYRWNWDNLKKILG